MASPKIKFVSWFMIVFGALSLTVMILALIQIIVNKYWHFILPQSIVSLLFGGPLAIAVLYIIFAIFLLKGKEWAWYASAVLLLKDAVASLVALLVSLSRFVFSFSQEMDHLLLLQSDSSFFNFILYISVTIVLPIIILAITGLSLVFLLQERKKYFSKA